MPVHFPDEANSAAEQRWLVFQDLVFGRGWMRYTPPAAIDIFGALATAGPMTRADLGKRLRRGWDAEAWEPPTPWTDAAFERARRSEEGAPFEHGPEETAATANASMLEEHERQQARSDGYARALGLQPVRTYANVLDYMFACAVVVEREEDGQVLCDLNPDVGLPSEVLPLTDEDRAEEDELRWRDVHEATAQEIIGLFKPDDDEPLDRKRTSLTRLARELDCDFESARAGVLNLLEEGDFTATIDVENAAPHKVFELIVDWERFCRTRIGIRFAHRGDDDVDDEQSESA